jgi:hypothetical protein
LILRRNYALVTRIISLDRFGGGNKYRRHILIESCGP